MDLHILDRVLIHIDYIFCKSVRWCLIIKDLIDFSEQKTFLIIQKIVDQNNLEFNWSFQIVNGVAHSNSRMSRAAAQILLN